MSAVCGVDAVEGKCKHSVVQQLSTMPSWLYINGMDPALLYSNPWHYNGSGWDDYGDGANDPPDGLKLKDESCKPMAAYVARVVAHYTAGGHHDSCGHWHPSGFHYNWTGLSVLNENEHETGKVRYTRCFDEIHKAVRQVNPKIFFAGPEGTDYTDYLIDPRNHEQDDPILVPDILSMHMSIHEGAKSFFEVFDEIFEGGQGGKNVPTLVAMRDKLTPIGSRTALDPVVPTWSPEFVVNEFIPFVNDWCDERSAQELFDIHPSLSRHPDSPGEVQKDGTILGGCPNWQDPRSNPVKMNRETLSWNAAAACFAYGFAKLALQGFKYVGDDQLVGGPVSSQASNTAKLRLMLGLSSCSTRTTLPHYFVLVLVSFPD